MEGRQRRPEDQASQVQHGPPAKAVAYGCNAPRLYTSTSPWLKRRAPPGVAARASTEAFILARRLKKVNHGPSPAHTAVLQRLPCRRVPFRPHIRLPQLSQAHTPTPDHASVAPSATPTGRPAHHQAGRQSEPYTHEQLTPLPANAGTSEIKSRWGNGDFGHRSLGPTAVCTTTWTLPRARSLH